MDQLQLSSVRVAWVAGRRRSHHKPYTGSIKMDKYTQVDKYKWTDKHIHVDKHTQVEEHTQDD